MWLTYGCGKLFWYPSWWLWDKVNELPKRDRFYLVPMIKREWLIQLLQKLVGISPLSCFPPHKILEEFCQKLFLTIFFAKFRMCFWESDFKVKSGICFISAKNGLIATKQKQTYWLNARPQTGSSALTLAMTLTLTINFQGQIWKFL